MSERERQTRRLRLAMFSPLPPSPTGIADYTADLLPLLPPEWEIELFVDGSPPSPEYGRASVWPHEEWNARARARPFDLNIYQVGNSPAHGYMLPHVLTSPGLLVLHDAVLHPSRVVAHVGATDIPGYRAAAVASNERAGAALAHLVAAGLGSPALYWRFPLSEDLVRSSLITAVHGELLARWMRALVPGHLVESLVHWRAIPAVPDNEIRAWRSRLGAAGETLLIGSFGHLGPAHGIDVALEALAALAPEQDFRIVLVGSVDPSLDLAQRISGLGLQHRIECTGRVEDRDFAALLRAVDLGINLRYPTARSSSGTLQQLMQLGVPTAITDLIHLREIPDTAVLRVPPMGREAAARQLRRGLRRWLSEPEMRSLAGKAAAAWAADSITAAGMAQGYRDLIARAIRRQAIA